MKIISGFFFAIPFLMSVFYRAYFAAFFIGFSMAASLVYHIYDEKIFGMLDTIAAFMLIGSNLVLCYRFKFAFPYFHFAMAFVIVAFFFYFRQTAENYRLYHSLWHVSSAMITILCILGYINGQSL